MCAPILSELSKSDQKHLWPSVSEALLDHPRMTAAIDLAHLHRQQDPQDRCNLASYLNQETILKTHCIAAPAMSRTQVANQQIMGIKGHPPAAPSSSHVV